MATAPASRVPQTGNVSKAPRLQRVEGRLLGKRVHGRGHVLVDVQEHAGGLNRRVFNAFFPRTVSAPLRGKRKGALVDVVGAVFYVPRQGALGGWWIVVHKVLNRDGATVLPFRAWSQAAA
jgi:hypothetical protein